MVPISDTIVFLKVEYSYSLTIKVIGAFYYHVNRNITYRNLGGELEVVSLGSGTSFNISSYSDYRKLTANNFYINVSYTSKSFTLPTGSVGTEYSTHTINGGNTSKSYDASTGVLTVSVSAPRVVINGQRKWSNTDWQSFSESFSPSVSYTVYMVHKK